MRADTRALREIDRDDSLACGKPHFIVKNSPGIAKARDREREGDREREKAPCTRRYRGRGCRLRATPGVARARSRSVFWCNDLSRFSDSHCLACNHKSRGASKAVEGRDDDDGVVKRYVYYELTLLFLPRSIVLGMPTAIGGGLQNFAPIS